MKSSAEIGPLLEILHKWGIHTVGELASLDKDQLGVRLGPAAVQLWERANGKTKRLLKLMQPPESFAEEFEFENEIETAEPLLFMLRRFLQQLSLRLRGIYLVAKELKLQISFSDKNRYEHQFKIPEPTNDVEVLFRMLHTHLENFKSEFPITAVSLEAKPAKPSPQQFGLFETPLRDPGQLSETLARLIGLLGEERIGTPVVEETHRPDAFHMQPFSWNDALPGMEKKPLPSCALRRFRPFAPACIAVAEEKPAHITSGQFSGPILGQSGPYIASGNWWDDKSWERTEWDLQLANGGLCRAHLHESRWHLDGVYD